MKQVIRIGEEPKEEKVLKPIELTHCFFLMGWAKNTQEEIDSYELRNIVYLGKCKTDGDMFSAFDKWGNIGIFKGKLNDGVY